MFSTPIEIVPYLIGISLKILSALLFTTMAVFVKKMAETYPIGEIIFARSFFALVPLLIFVVATGNFLARLRTRRVAAHAWRGLIGAGAMFAFFLALSYLPLADVTAIGYAAPLIATALAAWVLKEEVRIYRWSAVAVGLGGVLVMLWPYLGTGSAGGQGGGLPAIGAAIAFAAAVGVAVATTQVRWMTRTETTAAIVFYFSLSASLYGLATLPFGWVWPSAVDAAVLVGIGLIGGVAQLCLTQAYRLAPASLVAPFDYTTMIWSVILGFLVFGDVPSTFVVSGALVVIAAGIFVVYREHRLGVERAKSAQARSGTVP